MLEFGKCHAEPTFDQNIQPNNTPGCVSECCAEFLQFDNCHAGTFTYVTLLCTGVPRRAWVLLSGVVTTMPKVSIGQPAVQYVRPNGQANAAPRFPNLAIATPNLFSTRTAKLTPCRDVPTSTTPSLYRFTSAAPRHVIFTSATPNLISTRPTELTPRRGARESATPGLCRFAIATPNLFLGAGRVTRRRTY